MAKKRKNKKELEAAKELAYIMYIQGVANKEIAERVEVSAITITNWVNDNNWKEKRAAKTITRTELINKTLEQINRLLEAEEGINADKLAKLASLVERLDKKNSPVLSMEVFIHFSKYMQKQAAFDKGITVEFIRAVNKLQDSFITTLMSVE